MIKTILITGAGGRIGSAAAKALFNEGSNVILCDISKKNLSKIYEELNSIDASRCNYHLADTTDPESIKNLISFQSLKYTEKIDGAIHAAYPTSSGWGDSIENLDPENLYEDLKKQLGGAIIFSKIIMEYFIQKGSGNLIHISSIQGINAPKFEHYENTKMTSPIEYSAIKSGIISITKWLAKYYKNKNIRVNCISPGGILDNQNENFINKYRDSCCNKGLLNADEIASVIVFLLSENAYSINGQNIIIDDGWSL
tara:strand:+ start:361 stop:1125 length:765 start_codon:yes stop_codon:yes gene_type:complete